jgi:hypothetical protein
MNALRHSIPRTLRTPAAARPFSSITALHSGTNASHANDPNASSYGISFPLPSLQLPESTDRDVCLR